MVMPAVSLTRMAMNESVATTCCFREEAYQTNVYWSVLNGGWIGQAYVEDEKWNDLVDDSWFTLNYDVSNVEDGSVLIESIIGNEFVLTVNGSSLNMFLSDGVHEKLKSCQHTDGSCAYALGWSRYIKPNQHCNSTARHSTAGTGWSKPHDAKQWAS